jgi:hypothetical protein
MGQGHVRNSALFICEPLAKPFANRWIIDSLPGNASEGLADDFPDLLFGGIATLGKILRLFEPFSDNPCFSPVSLLRGFLEPPPVGVPLTVVPKFRPASGVFNESSHSSIHSESLIACHPSPSKYSAV